MVRPGSSCPSCGHQVRWFDNVPIVSWLVLRGRCRDCGARISAQYPIIEAATAAGFVLVGWWWLSGVRLSPTSVLIGDLLILVALCWFLAAGIALAVIDARVQRLPDVIVLPTASVVAVILVIAAALTGEWMPLVTAVGAAVVLALFYLILAFAVPGGMGFGDVKLALPIGLLLGWFGIPSVLIGAFGAFVLGGVYGIILMMLRRRGAKGRMAFGPWMILAAWVGIIAGDWIADGYLRLIGMSTEGVM